MDDVKGNESKAAKGGTLWLNIIGICTVVVALMFLASTIFMFYTACNHGFDCGNNGNRGCVANLELRNIELCDSTATREVIQTICDNHKYLTERYNELVNDMRQETNNNLNKLNSWFSFWIGILALFGVLAPIMAEYRFSVANRAEMEKIKREATDLINEIQKQNKKIEENYKQYVAIIDSIDVKTSINTLSISHDERLTNGIERRNQLREIIFKNTLNSLLCIVEDFRYYNQNMNIDDREKQILYPDKQKVVLLHALVSLYSFLQKLKILKGHYQLRLIDNIQEELKVLIDDIVNHNGTDFNDILDRIKKVVENMSKTVYRI